jgi:trimeric autotransporter adhesin
MRFASTIRLLAVLFVALVTAPQALASNGAGDSPSLCCPSDLDGDGVVGSADLAEILAAWGPAGAGDPADLDESGEVDAIDIAILIGSWGGCPAPCLKTLVIGSVQLADGTPVADAVIVTELGGQGVSDAAGAFSFEVELFSATESLTVTAIASLEGTTFTGTKLVSPVILDGVTDAGVISITASTGCAGEFGWLPGFGLLGLNDSVFALAIFDDGSGGGPALYTGGEFTLVDGVPAIRIAKWNGTSWSSLGTGSSNGVNGTVHTLTVFDDGLGGGPALYAGGEFTAAGGVTANRVAKWNGVSWSSLGTGTANGVSSAVHALTVFDDGSGGGPALYAGGVFTTAGGEPANRIAKWNGVSWSRLGTGSANGLNEWVYTLTVFDDGSGGGPALYVGGQFTTAGGVPANRIAKWNGTSWSSLGTSSANGLGGVGTAVQALTVFDDGSGEGPALYAGGSFTKAGGAPANRIAKWNGVSWSSLGTSSANGVNEMVHALTVFDDGLGGGPALYAGGKFTTAGGAPANRIAKWNGVSWSPLGTGSANGVNWWVRALTVFDDGSDEGPALYVGGHFTTAGVATANRIARRTGALWSSLGTGSANGLNGSVRALTVFDNGSGGGPALYAGGDFTTAGGVAANRIAKWNGTSWSSLGTGSSNGVSSTVLALTVFDDGSGGGPALCAGGLFTTAGGVTANRIAKWNGTSWSSLGTGSSSGVNDAVRALTVFDDGLGGGPALYAGGDFTAAGGAAASGIARWDGGSWSALGTGSANGMSDSVHTLTVFDDGSGGGPALFAGGEFTTAGGVAANRVAKWNGLSWSSLGTSSANGVSESVRALTVFDDGSGGGPALFAGGEFTTAGGVAANRIAKWNGVSWSSLGAGSANGVGGGSSVWVDALTVFDDGSGGGPALYAGGFFSTAGGVMANRIARWNGVSWSPLATGSANGVTLWVHALMAFDDGSGSGPALYVGGGFTWAGGIPSLYLATWGCLNSDNDSRHARNPLFLPSRQARSD